MIAEIVFFTALVLFIILLARKAKALEKIVPFLRGLGQTFSNLTGSLRRTGSRFPSRPSFSFPKIKKTLRSNPTPPAEQGFWGEEAPESKTELPSYLEEGDSLLKKGKVEQAEQFFLRVASRHPNDPKIYARLGLLYLNGKNYSDAIESLKVATKLDRYNPSRHYNLALAYWGNKDVQRAIMSVREAISLDPVTPKYRQLLEQLLNGQ